MVDLIYKFHCDECGKTVSKHFVIAINSINTPRPIIPIGWRFYDENYIICKECEELKAKANKLRKLK